MLSGPLRDRFQLRQHLGFYSESELREILQRNAQKLSVQVESAASAEIALRSRGTPRIANNRLLWVRDYALARSDGRVTQELAIQAMEMTGIDPLGLDRQDRRYIETIIRVFGGGPAGIEAIAHTMNVSADTLVDEVEPFLLRSELIVRTSRGRCATAKGFAHLKIDPPKDEDLPLFR
jgi:Holliday junction DNA helicase RuvB